MHYLLQAEKQDKRKSVIFPTETGISFGNCFGVNFQ